MRKSLLQTIGVTIFLVSLMHARIVSAQRVCLPAPRLLTMMPMGGCVGTEVEVVITGQSIEAVEQLFFSDSRITAKPKLDAGGKSEPNRFVVSIGKDCPLGVHDARLMTRLGVSSARAFAVGSLPEVTQPKPTTSVATAMPLEVNSVCNAVLADRAVNHYSFEASKDQRIVVDCAAAGIDSKMNPVLVVADADGNDLMVERRGGAIDFTVPEDGRYMVKVHELTFRGGAYYFYRLALREFAASAPLTRLPSTLAVNQFSWPSVDLPPEAASREVEPNNQHAQAEEITLPCDIKGSFFPAADVDTFQFAANQGEVWWVEVASERLGRPTDPSVIVQRVVGSGSDEQLVDVAELADIPSPVKRSSNGYSYDGPPYNAGSTDVLGKVEIKEDGVYRLQLSDLFGGTRSDPTNEYRLIIRKASPDFALVAWALHMGLRNGDRNALSKPIALRGGATMPLEVVVVRRDGFAGEIDLQMDNLPDGVTATGVKIAKNQTRGIMLLTAHQDAPRGMRLAQFIGRAVIDGAPVERECSLASMKWPVPNAASEIPAPRLVSSIPVSVGGSEFAGITIAAKEDRVWETKPGQTLKIPLVHVRRGEFSGSSLSLQAFGAGFERVKFDVPLTADASEAVLNLATLKIPPGDHTIAFYGGAVAKYRSNPDAVLIAEDQHRQAIAEASELDIELKRLTAEAATASQQQKPQAQQAAAEVAARKKVADAAVTAAAKRLADAKKAAAPKDIVDIYVSEPIRIRVNPAESK